MSKTSDSDLISAALKNRDAFAEIVRRYHARVFRHCLRIVSDYHAAEDLAQEAFVRAYLHLDRYDPEQKFLNWILKIATNLCLNSLRDRGQVPAARAVGPELASRSESPAEVVGRRSWLENLLARLAPVPRAVFVMFHQDSYSAPEIAEILDIPVGTVKTHLHRARLALARAARGGAQ